MRTVVFLIALLALNPGLYSQNWRPLFANTKYHYGINNTTTVDCTVHCISTSVDGDDTILVLNRITRICDTCNLYSTKVFLLRNQPQFLKKEARVKPDGTILFENPGQYILKTNAPIGESWVFDSLTSINAQVSNSTVATVVGVSDSVKTIQLSNGDSILLSKNHGICLFPDFQSTSYYHLLGTQDPNLGEQVPGIFDFYNYQIGDVFQYQSCSQAFTGPSPDITYRLSKMTVLERQDYPDSIVYLFNYNGSFWGHNNGTFDNDQPFVVINSPAENLNAFNNELVIDPDFPPGIFDTNFCVMHTGLDNQNTVLKYNGSPDPDIPSPSIFRHNISYYTNEDILLNVVICNRIYQQGLGNTTTILQFFENSYENRQIGYVKNGDTTGTIYATVGITEINPENPDFQVYPNPAENYITIHLNNVQANNATLNIYFISGKEFKVSTINGNRNEALIDIHSLMPGMYYVTLSVKDHRCIKKFAVIR